MAEHAEVFISATTTDLGSYRREVKNALLTLGIFPIEQSNFALAHGLLTKVLHDLIGRCDAVIHLAGLQYGVESPQRPPGKPRRSYTQIEYDVTRKTRQTDLPVCRSGKLSAATSIGICGDWRLSSQGKTE
jgi:hypothetical protein